VPFILEVIIQDPHLISPLSPNNQKEQVDFLMDVKNLLQVHFSLQQAMLHMAKWLFRISKMTGVLAC